MVARLRVGAHVSIAGGLYRALERGAAVEEKGRGRSSLFRFREPSQGSRSGFAKTVPLCLKIVTITYAGLGAMRGWARAEGMAWTRRCPIGQQLVSRVDIDDSLGNVVTTRYRYADAYYDGRMREVRGFARAVTYALGDAEQPALVTDRTFDVGDSDEARKGLALSATRRTETGGVFDVVTTTYEVRRKSPDRRSGLRPAGGLSARPIKGGPNQMTEQRKKDLRSMALDLLDRARRAMTEPGSYPFLPEIVRSLENMRDNLDADRPARDRMAGGVGRLVTEYYAFSETELGTALLQFADEFAAV